MENMEIQIIRLQKDLGSNYLKKKMRIEIKSENALVIYAYCIEQHGEWRSSSSKSLLWGFKICEKR